MGCSRFVGWRISSSASIPTPTIRMTSRSSPQGPLILRQQPFDHNSMCRDNAFSSTQEVFDDDNAGVNDLIGYPQESMGRGEPFDSGDAQDPAPVQGFFSGSQANQDGYVGDNNFGRDGETGLWMRMRIITSTVVCLDQGGELSFLLTPREDRTIGIWSWRRM